MSEKLSIFSFGSQWPFTHNSLWWLWMWMFVMQIFRYCALDLDHQAPSVNDPGNHDSITEQAGLQVHI